MLLRQPGLKWEDNKRVCGWRVRACVCVRTRVHQCVWVCVTQARCERECEGVALIYSLLHNRDSHISAAEFSTQQGNERLGKVAERQRAAVIK